MKKRLWSIWWSSGYLSKLLYEPWEKGSTNADRLWNYVKKNSQIMKILQITRFRVLSLQSESIKLRALSNDITWHQLIARFICTGANNPSFLSCDSLAGCSAPDITQVHLWLQFKFDRGLHRISLLELLRASICQSDLPQSSFFQCPPQSC